MDFQASKKREKRLVNTVSEGKPLGPSAAIRIWYEDALNSVTSSMIEDYRAQIREAIDHPEVVQFFEGEDVVASHIRKANGNKFAWPMTDAVLYLKWIDVCITGIIPGVQGVIKLQDAAPNSVFQRVMARLNKKWLEVFRGFGAKYAEEMVKQVDSQSKSSTFFSMSVAGVKQPVDKYTEYVANTLQAAKDFNHTLITNIQADVHEKIYSAVMLSLTSPDPEQQGASGIQNALREVKGFSENRIKLIARDQTSKVYSSLAMERLEQNGCTHFKWLHSSAGKVPRQTHVDKDNEVFAINDPRLWEGPKSDQGPPGWAINCRCRMMPVFGYSENEDD